MPEDGVSDGLVLVRKVLVALVAPRFTSVSNGLSLQGSVNQFSQ